MEKGGGGEGSTGKHTTSARSECTRQVQAQEAPHPTRRTASSSWLASHFPGSAGAGRGAAARTDPCGRTDVAASWPLVGWLWLVPDRPFGGCGRVRTDPVRFARERAVQVGLVVSAGCSPVPARTAAGRWSPAATNKAGIRGGQVVEGRVLTVFFFKFKTGGGGVACSGGVGQGRATVSRQVAARPWHLLAVVPFPGGRSVLACAGPLWRETQRHRFRCAMVWASFCSCDSVSASTGPSVGLVCLY